MEIIECSEVVFPVMIGFVKEVSNPMQIKQQLDKLIDKLGKAKLNHKNLVITKVIGKDTMKKTVTMRVSIVVEEDNTNEFVEENPEYQVFENFTIHAASKISIRNDMNQFREAVSMFMKKMECESSDVNQYPVEKNRIIEVSRIAYDGTVLGFDLYLESA